MNPISNDTQYNQSRDIWYLRILKQQVKAQHKQFIQRLEQLKTNQAAIAFDIWENKHGTSRSGQGSDREVL